MNTHFYRRPINTAAFNYQASKQRYQVSHARKRETLPAIPEQEQAHKISLEVMGKVIRNRGDLFSANDLHQIAGGDPTKRPNEWLRNKQTQELVSEIQENGTNSDCDLRTGIPVSKIYQVTKGRGLNGVWLCEDLMYDYAAWLSPKFRLMMIRCFKQYAHAMQTRAKLRGESPELTNTLLITRREEGKDTAAYIYSNEHSLLNRVLLGMNPNDYMKRHGIPKGQLRDHLTPEQLARLDKLITHDQHLILMGYSYEERKAELIKLNDRLLRFNREKQIECKDES